MNINLYKLYNKLITTNHEINPLTINIDNKQINVYLFHYYLEPDNKYKKLIIIESTDDVIIQYNNEYIYKINGLTFYPGLIFDINKSVSCVLIYNHSKTDEYKIPLIFYHSNI